MKYLEGKVVIGYPRPDPTEKTTQALLREVAMLKELIETRIGSMEKRLDLTPASVEAQVMHLRTLHEEKFNSIQTQFKERDTRSERESRDNKVAVDAAFAAQKEAAAKQDESNAKAIDKSEKATTETIVKLQGLIDARTDALNDKVDNNQVSIISKIDDMKERTTLTEARVTSFESRGQGRSDGWGYIVAAVGLLIAAGSMVAMFMAVRH